MIGIDTNVILRYIARDDATQAALATRLIEETCSTEEPGFVCLVVVIEIVWVCETSYGMSRADIAPILRQILNTDQLTVEDAELVWSAVRLYETSKADFADCLVLALSVAAGCKSVMTFDKTAAKAGMTLLK